MIRIFNIEIQVSCLCALRLNSRLWIRLGLVSIVYCSGFWTVFGDQSIAELESRLNSIDAELGELAHLSLRGGVGSIGYRSAPIESADHSVWVEIELDQNYVIDQIVLAPVLWRDAEKGFHGDAFPSEFRVLVGTADDQMGIVVSEYRNPDEDMLRIAPVVISFPETAASWVRIECSRLSTRVYDGRHVFQLAEILVFSGPKNVALRQSVRASFEERLERSGAWHERFLVDGVMPYLMNSGEGSSSLAYVSEWGQHPPDLNVDLGAPRTFSGIHLHLVDQSDTVPQVFPGDLGVPNHLRIEGANSSDFSDARVLLDYPVDNIYETGPIMMWNISEVECRFVRVIGVESDRLSDSPVEDSRIGFAEIELLSNGLNVALGKEAGIRGSTAGRSPGALTDGQNVFGKILAIRQWLNELAFRHDLEIERVSVAAELNQKYLKQRAALAWMTWIVVALVIVIAFVILIERLLRVRNEARVRERIAANLHDELGANLHAIGMLGDIAEESVEKPARLIETVRRIRGLTERTGAAARYCTNMMEAEGLCQNLVDDMKQDAKRLLADMGYDITFEGESSLNSLKRRKRIDLFLFYKESLTNIIRHAHATKCTIRVLANEREVRLSVGDNGVGYFGKISSSLQRRARLMGATAAVEHPSDGGTIVNLVYKVRRFGIF